MAVLATVMGCGYEEPAKKIWREPTFFTGSVHATTAVGLNLDGLDGWFELPTSSLDEAATDCQGTSLPDLLTCLSARLATAEAALGEVNRALLDRFDSKEELAFSNAHQAWMALRNAECEEEFGVVWPGREAAVESLSCREQRTLVRTRQLSALGGSRATRCNRPDAAVRFMCDSERGDPIVICEAPILGYERGQVHVEFASAGADPIYVSVGSAESFVRYNHYSRFRTDYLEIAARLGDTEYRVFRHTEDSQVSFGLLVREGEEDPGLRVDCAGEIVDQLSFLPGILECDTENALGCGVFHSVARDLE